MIIVGLIYRYRLGIRGSKDPSVRNVLFHVDVTHWYAVVIHLAVSPGIHIPQIVALIDLEFDVFEAVLSGIPYAVPVTVIEFVYPDVTA